MEDYGPATYGERIAEVYDELYGTQFEAETAAAVEFLAGLAGPGPALELGIGTGRVALPLAARGIDVHGIDASPAMVARLRAKPGGNRIPVILGDFADVGADGPFRLIFVVFNTFFGLLTQEDQVRCFQNVARRLADDGSFVIEAFVPDPGRFERGQQVAAVDVGPDRVRLHVAKHDPVTQQVSGLHILLTESGIKTYPVKIRYAWPAELDLMARLAGLRLKERWGSWDRAPFTAASPKHISVYARD